MSYFPRYIDDSCRGEMLNFFLLESLMFIHNNYRRTLLEGVIEVDEVTTMATLIIKGMKLLNLMEELKRVILL